MGDDTYEGGGPKVYNFLRRFSPEMRARIDAGEVAQADVERDTFRMHEIIKHARDGEPKDGYKRDYKKLMHAETVDFGATFKVGTKQTDNGDVSGGRPEKTLMDVAVEARFIGGIALLQSKGLTLEPSHLKSAFESRWFTKELGRGFIAAGLSPDGDESSHPPFADWIEYHTPVWGFSLKQNELDAVYDFICESGLNLLDTRGRDGEGLSLIDNLINRTIEIENNNKRSSGTTQLRGFVNKLKARIDKANDAFAQSAFMDNPTAESITLLANAGHGPSETLTPAQWLGREDEAMALMETLPPWMKNEVAPAWEAARERRQANAMVQEPEWLGTTASTDLFADQGAAR